MKKALITGVTGQDGSYLAELLLSKGYEVHGLVRRASSFNTSRIDHLYRDFHDQNSRFFLHYADMTDSSRLTTLLSTIQPDEVYNLAAQSHVAISFLEPEFTGQVTGLSVVTLLEAIRVSGVKCRYYQASSSELFGDSKAPQNETTEFRPRSPYAAAKLYAYWITRNYREAYGLHATNGILFNHESPRRGEIFVTRKITRAVARIAQGIQEFLYLGNLDSVRDWGYAPEYVLGMWKMLQIETPEDFVLATGQPCTVREFVANSFEVVNLDWEKYVKYDPRYERPTEVNVLIGDASKAAAQLDWRPNTFHKELARIMVEADLNSLSGQ